MTREKFIERAEQITKTIFDYWKLEDAAAQIFGTGCFENITETGIITQLIQTLTDSVDDTGGWIEWIICENYCDFPIENSAIDADGDYISFYDWGDVYDRIFKEKH